MPGFGATYYIRDGASNVKYNQNSCAEGESWTGATYLEDVINSVGGAGNTYDLCDCAFSGDEVSGDNTLELSVGTITIQNGVISASANITKNYLVYINNLNSVTFSNVTLDGSAFASGSGYGLRYAGTSGSTNVTGCTFQNFGFGFGYAILGGSTGNSNSVTGSTFTGCLRAVSLANSGSWTISSNTMSGGAHNIAISGSSSSITASYNNISTWGTLAAGYGVIGSTLTGNNIVITHNTFTNAADNQDCIQLTFSSVATGVEISHNTITESGTVGDSGIVLNLPVGMSAVIEHNNLYNIYKNGIWLNGGTPIVRYNLIKDMVGGGGAYHKGAIVSMRAAAFPVAQSQAQIYDNVIDGSPNGIKIYGESGYEVDGIIIDNNTILNTTEHGIYFEGYTDGNEVIVNNIIYPASGLYAEFEANAQPDPGNMDYNIFYGLDGDDDWVWGATTNIDTLTDSNPWDDTSSQDTHSIAADPSLSGYCPDSSTDPSVDAGTATGISGQTDFYGKSAWNTIDIGACEYQPGNRGNTFYGVQMQ